MTTPRLPTIGDHVWRVVDGKTMFDGYVADGDYHSVSGWRSAWCVPKDIVMVSASTGSQEHHYPHHVPQIVAHIFLVRQLGGWRWAPHEFRPEARIGDTISWDAARAAPMTAAELDIVPFRAVLVRHHAERGCWAAKHAHPTKDGFNTTQVLDEYVALALAGLHGFLWEPAGWPGEPKAGP